MNCFNCKEPISDIPHPHLAVWSTQPPIFVRCVQYPCGACGEKETVITKVHRLAQRVAEAIAHLPHRLTQDQFDYLLKHLDITSQRAWQISDGRSVEDVELFLRRTVTPSGENLKPFAPAALLFGAQELLSTAPYSRVVGAAAPMTFSYANGDWYEEE